MSSIHLPARLDALGRLKRFVRSACREEGVGEEDMLSIELICDELAANVCRHAYGGTGEGSYELEIRFEEGECIIRIVDSAPPFDPTQRKEADTSASLEEREIGGLGIHLVRRHVDRMRYRRRSGQNVVTVHRSLRNDG